MTAFARESLQEIGSAQIGRFMPKQAFASEQDYLRSRIEIVPGLEDPFFGPTGDLLIERIVEGEECKGGNLGRAALTRHLQAVGYLEGELVTEAALVPAGLDLFQLTPELDKARGEHVIHTLVRDPDEIHKKPPVATLAGSGSVRNVPVLPGKTYIDLPSGGDFETSGQFKDWLEKLALPQGVSEYSDFLDEQSGLASQEDVAGNRFGMQTAYGMPLQDVITGGGFRVYASDIVEPMYYRLAGLFGSTNYPMLGEFSERHEEDGVERRITTDIARVVPSAHVAGMFLVNLTRDLGKAIGLEGDESSGVLKMVKGFMHRSAGLTEQQMGTEVYAMRNFCVDRYVAGKPGYDHIERLAA